MKLAQITLPGGQTINSPIGPEQAPNFSNLGTTASSFINVFFYIAGFIMVIWAFWGVFKYIFAEGNKDALAKARSQITWAIFGFLILVIAFAISTVIRGIFNAGNVPVRGLDDPAGFNFIPTAHAIDLGPQFSLSTPSLGDFISRFVPPLITVAGLAILFYLLYGGFKYLTSSGNKDSTAQAREMITHAIIGFILLLFLFLVIQFLLVFFGIGIQLIN